MPKLWRVRWACGAGASFSIMIAVDIDIGECGVVGDHLESVWLTEIVRLVKKGLTLSGVAEGIGSWADVPRYSHEQMKDGSQIMMIRVHQSKYSRLKRMSFEIFEVKYTEEKRKSGEDLGSVDGPAAPAKWPCFPVVVWGGCDGGWGREREVNLSCLNTGWASLVLAKVLSALAVLKRSKFGLTKSVGIIVVNYPAPSTVRVGMKYVMLFTP
ncbi:hypothetical protein FPQ18DRAFT_306440 [Pyronema domesticum]|nr:hypothetical protein FPQ18DRAFT_306440 [Pyronema domesticum]